MSEYGGPGARRAAGWEEPSGWVGWIAVDIQIIWAVTVHGAEMKEA